MAPQSPEGSNPGSAFELGDLLARVANWDRAAFARLYDLTHAKLYGIVSRIVRGPDASCDVLQDVYVRLWERAGDYDASRGAPLAWMATIARNRALDEVRRVRPISLEDISGNFEPAAEEVNPLRARQNSEEARALLPWLAGLLAREGRGASSCDWLTPPV